MPNSLFEEVEEHSNYVILRNIDDQLILYEKILNTVHNLSNIHDASVIRELKSAKKSIFFGIRTGFLRDALETEWGKLELEVTENCNLRCKYCIYGGNYSGERKHAKTIKNMPANIADQALALYIKHLYGGSGHIGFWGGEPLLNIGLIKHVVDVCAKQRSLDVTFHITSNMLLAERYLEFLMNDSIFLSASLDGPRKYHDAFRQHNTGEGTYDAVFSTLKSIEKQFPEYFARTIITVTLSHPSKIDEVREYFKENFPSNSLKLSYIKQANLSKPIETYSDDQLEVFNDIMYSMAFEYVNLKSTNPSSIDSFLSAFFDPIYRLAESNPVGVFPKDGILFPPGACIPVKNNLFVDTDGDFYPCSETAGKMYIGNVYDGVQIDLIEKEVNRFLEYRNDICRGCWAQRICRICYATIKDKDGNLSTDGLLNYCHKSKDIVLSSISLYSAVLSRLKKGEK